jgi:hypothetical protein
VPQGEGRVEGKVNAYMGDLYGRRAAMLGIHTNRGGITIGSAFKAVHSRRVPAEETSGARVWGQESGPTWQKGEQGGGGEDTRGKSCNKGSEPLLGPGQRSGQSGNNCPSQKRSVRSPKVVCQKLEQTQK